MGKYTVKNSRYLPHLLPGDVVLVDRYDVEDSLALYGATLDIPSFTMGCDQLSAEDVEATCMLKELLVLFTNASRIYLLLESSQRVGRKENEWNYCFRLCSLCLLCFE